MGVSQTVREASINTVRKQALAKGVSINAIRRAKSGRKEGEALALTPRSHKNLFSRKVKKS